MRFFVPGVMIWCSGDGGCVVIGVVRVCVCVGGGGDDPTMCWSDAAVS
jgi:hypothetical protein